MRKNLIPKNWFIVTHAVILSEYRLLQKKVANIMWFMIADWSPVYRTKKTHFRLQDVLWNNINKYSMRNVFNLKKFRITFRFRGLYRYNKYSFNNTDIETWWKIKWNLINVLYSYNFWDLIYYDVVNLIINVQSLTELISKCQLPN